jgi:uncharacterized membrane protein (Fun14 family)
MKIKALKVTLLTIGWYILAVDLWVARLIIITIRDAWK